MDKRDKLSNGQRTVLVLNINKEPFTWQKKLLSFDWVTVAANNLTECLKLISSNDIKIAIAIISIAYQQKVFNLIEKINSANDSIKWLAIFIDEKLTEEAITPKFTRYFIDYHHLPIDWDKLAHSLGHSYGMAKLIKDKTHKEKSKAPEILGNSTLINKLKVTLEKVAQVDSSVLVGGETGTGKDLCAHLIHHLSTRYKEPFITVNCAALPPSLVHSELFGHEKGSFTGAETTYIGHIERSNKGTLFLDEIGDLPLELQVNLLKFLEDHTIERVGGLKPIEIDCRIIAASHVDLEASIAEGLFRDDLYHRLNIIKIHVPSLREHRDDIELLANHYLKKLNHSNQQLTFTDTAIETMLGYDWPGNVRELKNRIERAIVLAENNEISETDLGIKHKSFKQAVANLAQKRNNIDTEVLLAAIKRNDHNISAAARELKISRTTFYRLIKKCNIKL